jgi:hypothetical protein
MRGPDVGLRTPSRIVIQRGDAQDDMRLSGAFGEDVRAASPAEAAKLSGG